MTEPEEKFRILSTASQEKLTNPMKGQKAFKTEVLHYEDSFSKYSWMLRL